MAPATTFTWAPTFSYEMEPEFRTDVTEFQNGAEERSSLLATPIRRWRLVFRGISSTVFEAIKSFFIARKGRYGSFNWVCLQDGQTYIVRFDDDSLPFTEIDKDVFTVNCTLRTCTE